MTIEQMREAIKAECQKRGWSVLDLARASQVSPEAIRRFVNGRGEISPQVRTRLLKALGLAG